MIRRLTLAGLLAVILGAAAVLAGPPVAGAHPLGNFTTNAYAGIAVAPEAVRVDYIVDLAEVPALQARQRIDTDGDDRVDDAESTAYRAEACAELAAGLDLMVAGRPVPLVTGDSALSFADGQGGLTTLRLECSLAAPLDPITDEIELALVDHNHPGRLGWREITIAGDGTTVASATAPDVSVSDRLRAYPDAEVVSPLDQRAAEATIRPGGDRLEARGDATLSSSDEPRSRGNDGLTERFLDLVDRPSLGLGFALFALGVATVLGALHALAPGHGKTLMAAYVVGRRGTWRQVTAIGATVAATHTGGVVVLGLAVSASQTFAPEDLFPWFSVVSGALLASVGAGLLYRRMRMRIPAGVGHGHQHGDHDHLAHDDDHHAHDHDDGHAHHHVQHHGHGHHRDHHHGHHHHVDPEVSGWRGIVAMGLAGGLVPSPSALVVLLGAVALGRLWFGIALVAAYGIGMTVTLVSAGLLLVRFRRWVEERLHRPRVTWAVRVLPSVTAALLLLGGLSIVVRNLPNV